MKFKHTFHVFIDNFSATYKVLLYRVIVFTCFILACIFTVYPFVKRVMDTAEYIAMNDALRHLANALAAISANGIQDAMNDISANLAPFGDMIASRLDAFVPSILLIIVMYFIEQFLMGLCNYTIGTLINDKMTLQADSSFVRSFVQNLGRASAYNGIYVPLSIIYDSLSAFLLYVLLFDLLVFVPLLGKIFLFTSMLIALVSLKLTFVSDWLPSLVYGKLSQGKAIAYTFSRKRKKTSVVFSNYFVLCLLIVAGNVAAVLLTFGAGILITIPATAILVTTFQFINYCDGNNIKYFLDKNTVIKPEHEHTPTREEFFKGEY